MITLIVLFTVLYLISWYNLYKENWDVVMMPLFWDIIWRMGTILLIFVLCTMCVAYLP
jgi:hypothetical protein